MAKVEVCKQSKQDCALDGYSVRLTAWHARQARKLSGNKELGDGIRKAIEIAVLEMQKNGK